MEDLNLNQYEVWFVTGSQYLYGEETLKQVAADSKRIAEGLNDAPPIPVKVVFKPTVTSPEDIYKVCKEANSTEKCVGLITWMHTFSPAKMWIAGLKILQKPIVHLHTQFNRDIPWPEINMDFMNLNQSAHGGREFGFMLTRMRIERKVIVGYWQDPRVQGEIGVWVRAACAWADTQNLKIARFGDNMREVAVTEGDKVEAQLKMGYSVYGYGIGDLVKFVNEVTDSQISQLVQEYETLYNLSPNIRKGGDARGPLLEAARIELGMRGFLENGGFKAFTTTFEDLHGLSQLPGLAVQRLMADGYGFGAEGDWKTSALVRAVKVMASGLKGGTSFMEDYTYHLDPSGMKVLGAHMLEVCESIAGGKPSLSVHPLGIGGKADPPRLIFTVPGGPGLNASIMDMGNRFRMLVNEVNVVKPGHKLPKLPVASALWMPKPNLEVAAAAWIYAGGAHHTAFSQAITPDYLQDYAEIANIEYMLIDDSTEINAFKKELRFNEVYYHIFNKP
ncbi:L-arabinose isomerase [hydrothermal vent metagenome]|uniref:L-arabinose isomerase n=1 Tax=hydrothermal vent metagenome TaxID=652676 RepID=A0A3B0TW40_9ZZZZ